MSAYSGGVVCLSAYGWPNGGPNTFGAASTRQLAGRRRFKRVHGICWIASVPCDGCGKSGISAENISSAITATRTAARQFHRGVCRGLMGGNYNLRRPCKRVFPAEMFRIYAADSCTITPRLTPSCRANSRTDMLCSITCAFSRSNTRFGRPNRFPCFRARLIPMCTRSLIRLRSNSATAPNTVKIIFSIGVDVSILWHLRDGINGDLSARCITLAVPVHHFERDFLNVQGLQCPCSIPCRYRGHLIFGAVGLRQHEPIPTEHEPLERDFGFGLITILPLLCDGALARDGHAKPNCLFSSLHMTA